MRCMSLEAYIAQYFGTKRGAQTTFATSRGVRPQQVTKWIAKKWLVVIDEAQRSHILSSPKDAMAYIPVATNGIDVMNYDNIAFRDADEASTPTHSVYLQLDVESGVVSVVTEAIGEPISEAVSSQRQLRFEVSPYTTIEEVSAFVDFHLTAFQRVLAVFRLMVEDGVVTGQYVDGLETTLAIEKLADTVNAQLFGKDINTEQ